jgi:hypothetical protein
MVGVNFGIMKGVAMFYHGEGQDMLNVKNYSLILGLTAIR